MWRRFSNLTLNNVGVGYVLQVQATLDNGVQNSTSNAFAVSPSASVPYNKQVTVPVSSVGAPTVQVSGFNPLFAVRQQLDLSPPAGTSSYFYNARGYQEKYLVSGNGSNTGAGGYYVIMPNGNLYAWLSNSMTTTLAADPVAQPGTIAYADPTQLTAALPPYNATASSIENGLDLQVPPGAGNYFVNSRGDQEKYLLSAQRQQLGRWRVLYPVAQRQSVCLDR